MTKRELIYYSIERLKTALQYGDDMQSSIDVCCMDAMKMLGEAITLEIQVKTCEVRDEKK